MSVSSIAKMHHRNPNNSQHSDLVTSVLRLIGVLGWHGNESTNHVSPSLIPTEVGPPKVWPVGVQTSLLLGQLEGGFARTSILTHVTQQLHVTKNLGIRK